MSNYGAVNRDGTRTNGNTTASDEENAALLNKPRQTAIGKRLHGHFAVNVDNTWADIPLLACYIITGLLDGSSVYIFGSFVSMQTGNTIYLGLGLVTPDESNRWIRSLISIISFCCGSFFFSRYHRFFGSRKRWVLASSYGIQTVLIALAAVLITIGPVPSKTGPIVVWNAVPLAMIAFQAAGQTVTSRALEFSGLTSVVLTTNYCDLFSDPKLFSSSIKDNATRNRRVVAPILLLLGAVTGGFWAHSRFGLAGALWTAVVVKALLVATWLLWKAESVDDDDEDEA